MVLVIRGDGQPLQAGQCNVTLIPSMFDNEQHPELLQHSEKQLLIIFIHLDYAHQKKDTTNS